MEQLVATSAEKCLEAPCRALLQASPPVGVEDKATTTGSVTHEEVDTPAGLLAALQKGVDHVVVVNHLDLTSLPSISSSITGSSSDALLLADSTKSIRVCALVLCAASVPASTRHSLLHNSNIIEAIKALLLAAHFACSAMPPALFFS